MHELSVIEGGAEPPTRPRQSVAELAPVLLEMLPGIQAQLARALGRMPSDGTVRRALEGLEESGAARRDQATGVWSRCQDLPTLAIPDDFDEQSIALFQQTLKVLQEQSTWRDHDAELLERYVRRTQDVREYRAAVDEAGRFQKSPRGGRVYAHPGIDKERDALRDVQHLADALVLTPDARKRHVVFGTDVDGGQDEFDL